MKLFLEKNTCYLSTYLKKGKSKDYFDHRPSFRVSVYPSHPLNSRFRRSHSVGLSLDPERRIWVLIFFCFKISKYMTKFGTKNLKTHQFEVISKIDHHHTQIYPWFLKFEKSAWQLLRQLLLKQRNKLANILCFILMFYFNVSF